MPTCLQYISGRFTTGYRATIGADFITKTLPHHNHSDEQVTLQIWVRTITRGLCAQLLRFIIRILDLTARRTRQGRRGSRASRLPSSAAQMRSS